MVLPFARQALPMRGRRVRRVFILPTSAGLGVFDNPSSFVTHHNFGYLLAGSRSAGMILALVGREPRRIDHLLVLIQFTLQSVFVALRNARLRSSP